MAQGTIVTTTTDEDDGSLGGGTGISLREAVKYSPTGDTVTFAPALSGQTIRLVLGELLISQHLTIDGSALPEKITLSGDKTGDGSTFDDTRVLNISGNTVVLDSIVISGGGGGNSFLGGGILVDRTPTRLTIKNSTCSTNTAGAGGAIYFDGDYENSSLTIQYSIFTGNTSQTGGAIYQARGWLLVQNSILSGNSAGRGGALYCDGGYPIVEDTTFSSNSAEEGGAICFFSFQLIDNPHTLTLDGCSLTGNAATTRGGAINTTWGVLVMRNSILQGNSAVDGGAIHSRRTTGNIQNSTLSGNSAVSDGGAIWHGDSFDVGKLSLLNSTLSGNSAGSGGGVYNESCSVSVRGCTVSENTSQNYGGGIYQSRGGDFIVENSTFAGNTAVVSGGGICGESAGFIFSILNTTVFANTAFYQGGGIDVRGSSKAVLKNSIIAGNIVTKYPSESNISGTFTGTSNITSGTPLLAPLGDYGGPTQTMPPLPGSPAIDTGGTSSLTTDQRGFPRVSTPDIGAAEYQGASDLTRFWPLDFDGDASPYGTEQALGTDPLISDPANSRNITAPVLNASGHPVLTFGIDSAAAYGTRWILRRSTDLLTFTEIYRFDGSTDTAVPGVTFLRTATGVTVTDTNPPPGGVFYRFEARLEP